MNSSITCNITKIPNNFQSKMVSQYTNIDFIQQVCTQINLIIGIPTNILSVILWNSNQTNHVTIFMLVIALTDLIHSIRIFIDHLENYYSLNIVAYSFMCKLYPVFSMSMKYTSNYLILFLILEHFIVLKSPDKNYLRKDKTRFCVLIFLASLIMAMQEGYYQIYYNSENLTEHSCYKSYKFDKYHVIDSIFINLMTSLFIFIAFIITPLLVLTVNLLIILIICKHKENHKINDGNLKRTTILMVSFYFVASSVPYMITYVMAKEMNGLPCLTGIQIQQNKQWIQIFAMHYRQMVTKVTFEFYYSTKFFIYLSSKLFRMVLKSKCQLLVITLKEPGKLIKRFIEHVKNGFGLVSMIQGCFSRFKEQRKESEKEEPKLLDSHMLKLKELANRLHSIDLNTYSSDMGRTSTNSGKISMTKINEVYNSKENTESKFTSTTFSTTQSIPLIQTKYIDSVNRMLKIKTNKP